MNVSLPEDLDQFVTDQLREGGYNNQSEIVREGLRLLRSRLEKRRRLNAALDIGFADVKAGRKKLLSGELLDDIAERGRQRARTRSGRNA